VGTRLGGGGGGGGVPDTYRRASGAPAAAQQVVAVIKRTEALSPSALSPAATSCQLLDISRRET
jgi:hypothetical protein